MFNKLIDNLKRSVSFAGPQNPLALPEKLHSNIKEYLSENEEIRCSIKNHRAIHNANSWRNRNTFFNSWCILTDKRLLILRNLNYVKVFREIEIPKIDDYRIEKSVDNLVINISTSGKKDTIEFSRHLVGHADKFSDKFTDTVKQCKEKYTVDNNGIIKSVCPKCSNLVLQQDKFCSNCGSSLPA